MTSSYDQQWDTLPREAPHITSGGSFWRKEAPEVGEKLQVLKGGMFDHQRAFYSLPNFVKVLVTGYGGGKTLIIGKRIIALALQNAPVPAAIFAPSYPQAKLTTVPTLKALLAGKRTLFGRSFWYRFNGQAPMHFRIRHRGREALIYVLSSDNPESLKGSNLCAVALEEPFIQPQAAFEQAVARTRDPSAQHRELLLAGTPEQLGWGYDLCEGELRDRYKPGVVRASSLDNLVLPEDVTQRMLAGYDRKAADAYVRGLFVNLSAGVVYYAFDRTEHVVDRSRSSGSKLGVGMDFNVNPMAFCVFWYTDTEFHVIKEYELENSDTQYACQVLREDWGAEVEDVFPDASGKNRATNAPAGRSDFTILRENGFTIHANNANPNRRDRYNSVNGKLKPANGKQTITVSPGCKRLIKYATQYTHEKMNREDHKAMSHLLDAVSYPIAYLWPVAKMAVRMVKYHGA